MAALEAQVQRAPFIDRLSLLRMVNAAPFGTLVVNREGRLDFANAAFQRWMVKPVPGIGEPAEDVIAPAMLAALKARAPAVLSGEPTLFEEGLVDVAGETRQVRVQLSPRQSGDEGVTGYVTSVYDLTDTHALDRAARERQEHLSRVNAVTPSCNYLFDFTTSSAVWVGGNAEAVYGHSAEELMRGGGALVQALIHPEDFVKVGQRLAYLAARPEGTVSEVELRVRRRDGSYRWILDRAVIFERGPDGRITRTLSAALDIDERKRAEERRTLLINELNHRVKNTLAAVQSIARQTLRNDRDLHEANEVFTARLVSLSAAHDVLTRENWEGAGLREVVHVALGPFDESRITVSGPELRLGARAALALGMALHELGTNATKYGALSGETGRVDLTWRARMEGGSCLLDLEWRERDGPPVEAPQRRGFGSRLLTHGVRSDLNGAAELEFAPEGVVCRITAPLETPPRPDLAG